MRHATITKREIQTYYRRLREIVARLGDEVSGLRGEALRPLGAEIASDRATQVINKSDPGTQVANADVALGLLQPVETIRSEIDTALSRIEHGTFGQCENCGKPIARTRIDTLPFARNCTRCARETEEQGPK